MQRCAGYAKPPRTEDVVNAIKGTRPTETEVRALRTYLRESQAADVRAAWLAGEFTLAELLGAADRVVNHEDIPAMHSVEAWIVIERL